MAKTRGERLKEAREKFFPSGRAAAIAIGMAPATYGAHERAGQPGGRDYDPEQAAIYGRRFKVDPEWLLTGRGRGPKGSAEFESAFEAEHPAPADHSRKTTRVVGYVGAGAAAHYYAVAQGDLDEVPAPEQAMPETVAVEIKGDSLGSLFDRWLVFYDDVRSPVTSDLIGKLCVVGLPDDRILIKKIRYGKKPGLYRLLSEREEPIEDVAIDWAAKVKSMHPR